MRRCLLFVAVAAACGSRGPSTADVDPTTPTKPETVVAPSRAGYIAIVKSKRSLVLTAAFTGRVVDIGVHPSQVVHAGEVLARQDTVELRGELEQSQAEQASAQATAVRSLVEAGVAERKLKVTNRLALLGVSSRGDVSNAIAEVAATSATARADRHIASARAAKVASIQDKIDHADITAPFDGVISMVHVKAGDSVTAGATVFRIFDPTELVVSFAVPSEDETPLARDMKVELELPHHAPIGAVITVIAEEIEPPFSYRIVEADIDARTLRPGELKLSAVGRVAIPAKP